MGKHLTTGRLSENRKMKPALQHLLVFMVKIFPLWLTVSSHGESPTAVWRRDAYDWLGQHQGLRAGEAEGVSVLPQLAGAAGCVHRWWEGCHAWSSAEVVLRESRTPDQARLPDCSVLLLEGAGELCPRSCGGSHSVVKGPLGRRPELSRKVRVKLLLGPHFQAWSCAPPMSYVPSCSGFDLGLLGPGASPVAQQQRIHLQRGSRRRCGFNPGSGRFPGGGHDYPLQYSCLENPTDRGAWQATIHRVAKSLTQLKQLSMHACCWAQAVSVLTA